MKQIEKTGNVIKAVAALLALFPGIVVLIELVRIPPSLATLIKVISFSLGAIVLLAVFLMGERIQGLSKARATFYAIGAVIAGALCTTAYFQFANSHIVTIEADTNTPQGQPETETHIIPLNPTSEITEVVEQFGNNYQMALQLAPNRGELKRLMAEQHGTSMFVMIALLIVSQILLVAPVVAAAWRLAAARGARGNVAKNRRQRG